MQRSIKVVEKEQLLPALIRLFPIFSRQQLKGDNGRISIIGGDKQYTGAPYFAAMAAFHSVGILFRFFIKSNYIIK